jgi:hypothetical protein
MPNLATISVYQEGAKEHRPGIILESAYCLAPYREWFGLKAWKNIATLSEPFPIHCH